MRFKKQIVQSLLWRGLYFVTVLIMNVFLTRYLEAGNAGWIFYMSNNFSLLLIVFGLTMETSVNYYGAKKDISYGKLTWFSIAWTTLVAIVLFGIVWLYLHFPGIEVKVSTERYLFYALSYIVGIQLTNFFTVLFYTDKNFFLPNFLLVLLNVVLIAIIAKYEVAQNDGATAITDTYFGFFAITGLTLAMAYIIRHKCWRDFSLPNTAYVKLLLRYALVALAANVIFFLVYRVDYWFVQKYCTGVELGNYILVSRLIQILLIVPTIISSVVLPHTASGVDSSGVKDNILRIGRMVSVVYIVLFIIVALTGRRVFPAVFGASYQFMYVPFLLLLPGVWALSNLYVLSAYFGGINKVAVNVKGAAIALVVILAGDILFIPVYGIKAAAIVSSAGYLVNFFYSFLSMKKEHTVSFREYWTINKSDIQWVKSMLHP